VASGKTHARSTSQTIIIACIIVVVALIPRHITTYVFSLISDNLSIVGEIASGLIMGHYATPDVRDQEGSINEGERMVREHYGRLAGKLWTWVWYPLAKIIPHRSWLSHLPGPATILAAAWLYWLPMLIMWMYAPEWYDIAMSRIWYHVAGWAIQDTVHLAQDGWRFNW